MKRILTILLAFAAIVVTTSSALPEKTKKDRTLEILWKKYEKADDADMVRDMADILEQLKAESLKRKSSWDYYMACDKYVNVMSMRNWKLKDQLKAQGSREMHDYGLPSLEIIFGLRHGMPDDTLKCMVERNAAVMKETVNLEMYRKAKLFDYAYAPNFNRLMNDSIGNDYEFVLWYIFFKDYYWNDWIYDEMEECLGDKYPGAPYAEYVRLKRGYDLDALRGGMNDMALKYEGKGMGFVARDELFELEFMDMEGEASSDDYRELEKRILSFLSTCETLEGEAAACVELCNSASLTLSEMGLMEASVMIKDSKAQVVFRNLEKVNVRISGKRGKVFETVVHNDVNSFYKKDTVEFMLPDLDDGEYKVEVFDENEYSKASEYEKYTVSLAGRYSEEGIGIYAADYISGRPVEKADLLLYDEDGALLKVIPDFSFDGFTQLPEELYPLMEDKERHLVCRYEKDGRVRLSRKVDFFHRGDRDGEIEVEASVLKDRGAYMPGDTVKFKAVLYEVRPDGIMSTLPAGNKAHVKLMDSDLEVISEMTLETNEFGSVSGSFVLDGIERNGVFLISVAYDDSPVGRTYLRVDEFVLPNYDLEFDGPDRICFPGDTVRVTGKVVNYSGHGFDGLKAECLLYFGYHGGRVSELPVEIAPDGSFEVSFTAGSRNDDYVRYNLAVKLVDETGETLEFEYASYVRAEMSLYASCVNADKGRFGVSTDYRLYRGSGREAVFSGGTAEIVGVVNIAEYMAGDVGLDYRLKLYGKTVMEGSFLSGDTLRLDMKGLAPELYEFELGAGINIGGGRRLEDSYSFMMLYVPEGNDGLPEYIDSYFRTEYEDETVFMQLGFGTGPVWAVVELFGDNDVLLEKEMIYLEGKAGSGTSVAGLAIPHLKEYSDHLLLNVFYFRNGKRYVFSERFKRPEETADMELKFTSFEDMRRPGQECEITLKTETGSELAATVFDASSEQIFQNEWDLVYKYGYGSIYVYYSSKEGVDRGSGIMTYGYGASVNAVSARVLPLEECALMTSDDSHSKSEEAVPYDLRYPEEIEPVRGDFSATLAFEPYIYPSKTGKAKLKFRTSDRLSTFKVMVYAHDKEMNDALISREMVVTLPVKVSVLQPQYLYEGDKCSLKASVSNTTDGDLKGSVSFELYDRGHYLGLKPLRTASEMVVVPSGGTAAVSFDVDVPADVDSLGIKVVFKGAGISDGLFVPIPVYPAGQILTESHSAVIFGGKSSEEMLDRLRGEFVNMSPEGAEYSEVTIMDMLRDALPEAVVEESGNAVSQSETWYMNLLAAGMRSSEGGDGSACLSAAANSLLKLLECLKDDGGFAWFGKMSSSPVVTAVVLERYAGLRDRGLLEDFISYVGGESGEILDEIVFGAVKYLDACYFDRAPRPFWYGGLSLGQYMNVRSMFADVPLGKEEMGEETFIKYKGDTSGAILDKVRKINILNNLLKSPAGLELAKVWGMPSGKEMKQAMIEELESLRQYSVGHPSGGVYYPNAVLPWRGLLESEAYAHAMICNLFKTMSESGVAKGLDETADGIRMWLMLQTDTQKWDSDPGFIDALAAVYDGSSDVKETKIMVLSKRCLKPFDEIKAAGNGLRISVDYYRDSPDGTGLKINEGDSLHVGDKITAVYSLWSAENRSHVCVSVPRAACFRPVNQLSGWNGGWFRPLSYGFMKISPYSYREVKTDRTLYWIDVFPEEDTAIREQLFVIQEGIFTSPVAEMESVYAPHYRANDVYHKLLEISK